MTNEVTREIMWNIPAALKYAMYGMFSTAYAGFGFYKKYQFVFSGKNVAELLPEKLNWKNFIDTIFFTGKVTRDSSVGIFHSLIYYGFIILWIATDLVAIHYDTPFKVFTGTTYIVVSFAADIAGIMLLLGIFLAYKRRYIKKPAYLEATQPKK